MTNENRRVSWHRTFEAANVKAGRLNRKYPNRTYHVDHFDSRSATRWGVFVRLNCASLGTSHSGDVVSVAYRGESPEAWCSFHAHQRH